MIMIDHRWPMNVGLLIAVPAAAAAAAVTRSMHFNRIILDFLIIFKVTS